MERCNQEETIKEIRQQIQGVNKKIESMPKVEFILEQLLESNKQLNESYRQLAETNQELKLTLTQLSFNIEALNIRQEKTDRKVANVENMVQKTDDKTKVDLATIQKSSMEALLTKLFGATGVVAILYFILDKFGVF